MPRKKHLDWFRPLSSSIFHYFKKEKSLCRQYGPDTLVWNTHNINKGKCPVCWRRSEMKVIKANESN